jgi:hypothetical protein
VLPRLSGAATGATMKRLLFAALLALAPVPAFADSISLFSTTASTSELSLIANAIPQGNQPQNNPCLICTSTQPQQPATFGYNDYKNTGNETSFIEFSSATVGAKLDQDVVGTGYAVSFLKAYLLAQAAQNTAGSFQIGIDVNTATGAGAEVLEAFAILNLTQMTIIAQYSLFDAIGTPLPTNNNGTGYPDYLMSGINLDRGDIALGDQIVFYARWSNASDGGESFFLVPTPQAVPGPLAGAGLPGLLVACAGLVALVRRRRKQAV